jgi:hypothetical protein
MAGVGNWQILLPDDEMRRLYSQIYPDGVLLQDIEERFRSTVALWQKADIAATTGARLFPLGPVMMDDDIEIVTPWFDEISKCICGTIRRYLRDYRLLARRLSGGPGATKDRIGNIVTILICAEGLDISTFSRLRYELIGRHPQRAPAGRFFFWGYAFSEGPKRIFGVTTYGRGEAVRLSVIRSRGLDRGQMPALLRDDATLNFIQGLCLKEPGIFTENGIEGMIHDLRDVGLLEPDGPPRLAIPIFSDRDIEEASRIHNQVATEITSDFTARMTRLENLISRCSFARCSLPDVLCMLFHLAYSYAADELVRTGTIPDFPAQAGGEWGVWIRLVGTQPLTSNSYDDD